MIYDFNTQLQQGQQAERSLDLILEITFQIQPANREQQRRGIDRLLTHRETGQRWRAEYKADHQAHTTGNAFVETISVDRDLKLGWAITSEADLLFYFIPESGLIYILSFSTLREQLPRWLRRYPCRSIPNQGYGTHGILVPLYEFETLARDVVSC